MSNVNPIIPKTPEDAWLQAKYYYQAESIKSSFRSVGEVYYVINLSLELGITPAQGLQNIAILQGRASIWGDLMLAIVHNSGQLEYHKESFENQSSSFSDDLKAVCKVKRRGHEEVESVFGVADAKKAGLWIYKVAGKNQRLPWAAYPERMMKMRARTFALRDVFPDFLKGLTSREEAMDIPEKESAKKVEKKAPLQVTSKNKKEEKGEDKKETSFSPPLRLEEKCYSDLFEEGYVKNNETGTCTFSSGVIYTKEDLKSFKNLSEDELKNKHNDAKSLLLDESNKPSIITDNNDDDSEPDEVV